MKALKKPDEQTVKYVLTLCREELRKIHDEELTKALAEQTENVDTAIFYTLHEYCGFGKNRLLRFARNLNKAHDFFVGRYDDYDVDAMQRELKKIGFDVKKIEQLLAAEREEENVEEKPEDGEVGTES